MTNFINHYVKNPTILLTFTLLSFQGFSKPLQKIDLGPVYKRLKLGIVVNNDHFKIYRSKNLGTRGLKKVKSYFEKHSMLFPKVVINMNFWGYKFPSYSALEEYELQNKYGFKFYHTYGKSIRTYLDGYNPYNPTRDVDTTKFLGSKARRYFELRDDGVDGGVDTFFSIMDLVLSKENQPVLFHCFGGRHRTGMVAMAIRYLQGGYWVDGPKKEAKGMMLNPAQYEYYKFNRSLFRKENIEFIEKIHKDPRFVELKIKHGPALREN